jgi:hypothetical protein
MQLCPLFAWNVEVKQHATTLEELEQRITRLEQALARLQRLVEQPSQTEVPAQRRVQLLYNAVASHAGRF